MNVTVSIQAIVIAAAVRAAVTPIAAADTVQKVYRNTIGRCSLFIRPHCRSAAMNSRQVARKNKEATTIRTMGSNELNMMNL